MAPRKPKSTGKKKKTAAKGKAIKLADKHDLVLPIPTLADLVLPLMDSGEPLLVSDLSGNALYRNDAFRRMIEPALAQANVTSMGSIIQELEQTGLPVTHDVEAQWQNQRHLFRAQHRLLHVRQGMSAVISRYENVTSEQAVRQRLLLTQSRLDDLTRLTADWVWETNSDLKLQLASPRVMEALGYHPRELLGKGLLEIGHIERTEGESSPNEFDEINRLIPFRDITFIAMNREGRLKTFKLSGLPVFSDAGQFMGYRGTATDITQELEARRLARLLEERLGQAIENMSEGFSLFDKDGRLVVANSKLKNFYPKSSHILKPGQDKEKWLRFAVQSGDVDLGGISADEWLKMRLDSWEKGDSAFEVRLADGRHILVRDYRTHDGGTVSIRTDITGIKQREDALIDARNTASEANKAKGEFFAKMSHELRTPLNAIIGFSDIMQQGKYGPLGAKQYQEYVTDIHDSATHLLNVINDILDVSRAEAGKLELVEQNVSVISTVQSTMRMIAERAERSGVKLEMEVDSNMVLRADQKKVKQILINLLSNAVKFTLAGGIVSAVAYLDKDGQPVLSVRDTGIGMKEEDIPKALTPFAQIDNSLTRQHDGTGLGLPLCVALAELHGGKMQVESAPNKGTTVRVIFPKNRLVIRPVGLTH